MKDTIHLTNKGNTLMIAHRGASCLEQENTLPAFIAAGNRTYFGAECDVHVTTDKKYPVYHDDNTARLCDKDVVLEESDFKSVRALRLRERESEAFSETLVIPSLEEYLAVMAHYEKVAVVELKNHMQPQDVADIISVCKKCYALDKIIFISFDFENLLTVRRYLPAQTVQYLTAELEEGLAERLQQHKMDVDIGWWLLSEEHVKNFHAHGVKVNCWTCDTEEDARKLISWGVDFITSNTLE